ncbi:MAG: hypothetical protein LBQ18_07185 [Campylobacteraceae bacterium]|jgi:hypothetical protein|nr:hypothetical protein [Campylobacteraceae bacterium]
MGRYIAALGLSVGVLLANTSVIEVGKFTIESAAVPQENIHKITVFSKDKKKLLYAKTFDNKTCDANFLFSNTRANNEPTFGLKCDSEESADEYKYDPKNGSFERLKALEGMELREIAQTKDFYIGLNFDYSGEYAKYDSVMVFQKPSNRFAQKIAAQRGNESLFFGNDAEYCAGYCIDTEDYNFDGYEDFSLSRNSYAGSNADRIYFLYNPKKKEFFLSSFEGVNLEFDHINKTITSTDICCMGSRVSKSVYKVANNKMKLIKESCFAVDYGSDEAVVKFEYDCKESYSEYYFESVGLNKNFELKILLDKELKKGGVLHSGQKEYSVLKLKEKEGEKLVYDEINQGNKTGSYIISEDLAQATYIVGDKKIQFKATEN